MCAINGAHSVEWFSSPGVYKMTPPYFISKLVLTNDTEVTLLVLCLFQRLILCCDSAHLSKRSDKPLFIGAHLNARRRTKPRHNIQR